MSIPTGYAVPIVPETEGRNRPHWPRPPTRLCHLRQNVMLRVNRTESGSTGLKWTS
jgi:hypothetical protein